MALVKQDIDLPLGEGVQQGMSDKLLDQPKLAELVDCRLDKRGEIAKRYGSTALSVLGISSTATPETVLAHRNALLQLTSEGMHAYDATDARWNRTNAAGPRPCVITTDPVARGNGSYVDGDVAYDAATGVIIVVSHDRARSVVNVSGIEAATGAVITTRGTVPAQITHVPKIVTLGGRFVLFGRSGSSTGDIYAASYDPSLGTFAFGAATLIHSGPGDTDYDVHADGTYAHCAVARPTWVGGWTCYQVTSAPAVTASITPVGFREAQSIAVRSNPGVGIYVLFYDTHPSPDQVSVDIFDEAYTTVAASPTKAFDVTLPGTPPGTPPYRLALTVNSVANEVWCFASTDRGNGTNTGSLMYRALDDSLGYVTNRAEVPNLFLATRAATDLTGRAVVGVVRDVDYTLGGFTVREPQPSGFLVTPQSVSSWEIDPANPTNPPTLQTKLWLAVLGRFGIDSIEMRGGKVAGSGQLYDLQTDRHTSALVDVDGKLMAAYTVGVGAGHLEDVPARSAVDVLTADVSPGRVRSAESEELALVATGELQCFDGVRHTELAIPVQPHGLLWNEGFAAAALGTDTTAGGIGAAAGDYTGTPSWGSTGVGHYQQAIHRYIYCFRWVDSRGNLHRSGFSDPVEIGRLVDRSDVNPADFVDMDFGASGYTAHNRVFLLPKPTPTALSGEDDVRIQVELYRRPVEFVEYQVQVGSDVETNREIASHGDATYRLVGVLDIGDVSGFPCLGWVQDPLSTVGLSDPQAASAPSPYVDSGELPSEAIGPTLDVCSTQQRLFAIDAEDRLRVYFSKPFARGYAPEFNGALTLRCASEGGDLVACETLDDKLILFKQSRIYVTPVFSGPDALGNGTAFDAPREISSDVGCVSRKSVATGPFGICFQSQRGIYLLGRDLGLTWVGEAVRDSLAGRTIQAATVVPVANEVRWVLDDGTALVWEYRLNQWMTHANVPSVDTCIWLDRWTRVLESRTARYDDSTTYSSNPGRPLPSITTSWIKLAGLQGFQRVWRATLIGTHITGHLGVQVGYDYESGWTDTHTLTQAQINALPNMQLQLVPSRQKCQAIRFRIYEIATLGDVGFTVGEGFKLQGIRLRVGMRQGTYKHLGSGARR
jgi:hypothetical protein